MVDSTSPFHRIISQFLPFQRPIVRSIDGPPNKSIPWVRVERINRITRSKQRHDGKYSARPTISALEVEGVSRILNFFPRAPERSALCTRREDMHRQSIKLRTQCGRCCAYIGTFRDLPRAVHHPPTLPSSPNINTDRSKHRQPTCINQPAEQNGPLGTGSCTPRHASSHCRPLAAIP